MPSTSYHPRGACVKAVFMCFHDCIVAVTVVYYPVSYSELAVTDDVDQLFYLNICFIYNSWQRLAMAFFPALAKNSI